MEKEEATNREAVMQVSNVIKWADIFDEANKETRHMILARLINRVEVGAGYKIMVKFKITYEQFLGLAAWKNLSSASAKPSQWIITASITWRGSPID